MTYFSVYSWLLSSKLEIIWLPLLICCLDWPDYESTMCYASINQLWLYISWSKITPLLNIFMTYSLYIGSKSYYLDGLFRLIIVSLSEGSLAYFGFVPIRMVLIAAVAQMAFWALLLSLWLGLSSKSAVCWSEMSAAKQAFGGWSSNNYGNHGKSVEISMINVL